MHLSTLLLGIDSGLYFINLFHNSKVLCSPSISHLKAKHSAVQGSIAQQSQSSRIGGYVASYLTAIVFFFGGGGEGGGRAQRLRQHASSMTTPLFCDLLHQQHEFFLSSSSTHVISHVLCCFIFSVTHIYNTV